jgi:hypothetical protein
VKEVRSTTHAGPYTTALEAGEDEVEEEEEVEVGGRPVRETSVWHAAPVGPVHWTYLRREGGEGGERGERREEKGSKRRGKHTQSQQ